MVDFSHAVMVLHLYDLRRWRDGHKWHPDRFPEGDSENKRQCAAEMAILIERVSDDSI